VRAFVDGYHTGLWVTIGLLAAGVLVSYLTLRPRGRAVPAASEPTAAVAQPAVAVAGPGPPGMTGSGPGLARS